MVDAREINIRKAVNGYIVNVGCKTFVFLELAQMTAELERYLTDPEKVEKEYRKKYKIDLGYEKPMPIMATEEVACTN